MLRSLDMDPESPRYGQPKTARPKPTDAERKKLSPGELAYIDRALGADEDALQNSRAKETIEQDALRRAALALADAKEA